MALKKLITEANGVVSQYHRVHSIYGFYGIEESWVKVTITHYIDSSFRDLEKNDKTSKMTSIDEIFYAPEELPDISRDAVYAKLKEDPKYIDAVDC